jgi:paraquat-inducible protein A
MKIGLQSCEDCGLLSRPAPGAEEGRCPRCDATTVYRKHASIQRTWALVIAAAICYLPANLLPVMVTTGATGTSTDTIMQGVVLLWSPTGWPLSLIVLFASIMIPSAKILALVYLLITVQRGSIQNAGHLVHIGRTDASPSGSYPTSPFRLLRRLINGFMIRHDHMSALANEKAFPHSNAVLL